jgi:hypothetical protein
MSAWPAIVSSVASVGGVFWFRRLARAPARHDGPYRIVEYPVPFRIILAAVTVEMLCLFASELTRAPPEERTYAYFWLLPLAFALLVALSVSVFRIRFSRDDIDVRSLWKARRLIPRSAVKAPRPGYVGWKVSTDGFGSFRFNPAHRGWVELLADLRAGENRVTAN